VEYIKMMQALATRQQERMSELENVVRVLLEQAGASEQDLLLSVPLGTVFELPQMVGGVGNAGNANGGGNGGMTPGLGEDCEMDED
jgi:hypothetical protein